MDKILVVEDDKSLAMGIEYALVKEALEVTVADCVEKAIELYEKDNYDLILLDVSLPDGNGFDLCKKIRENSKVPIIFLTACDEEINIVLGLDIGADDYITKPFRVKELISRIKVCLRRKAVFENGLESMLVSGDLMLDTKKQKLLRNNGEVFLTPLEYKLIAEFMRNSNHVLSRVQILERVYDIDGEFLDDNTLSVYIRRLREKIESDPSKPEYIVTIRGVGYSWDKGVNV